MQTAHNQHLNNDHSNSVANGFVKILDWQILGNFPFAFQHFMQFFKFFWPPSQCMLKYVTICGHDCTADDGINCLNDTPSDSNGASRKSDKRNAGSKWNSKLASEHLRPHDFFNLGKKSKTPFKTQGCALSSFCDLEANPRVPLERWRQRGMGRPRGRGRGTGRGTATGWVRGKWKLGKAERNIERGLTYDLWRWLINKQLQLKNQSVKTRKKKYDELMQNFRDGRPGKLVQSGKKK